MREATAAVAEGLLTGNFEAFHEWNESGQGRQSVDAQLERVRADLIATNGEFLGLGAVVARTGGQSSRTFVEARFARGSTYLLLGWRNGRIGMFDVSAEPPWPAGGELRVFPFTTTDADLQRRRGAPRRGQ